MPHSPADIHYTFCMTEWSLNRRGTGSKYEQLAAMYLMNQGVQILYRNFRDGRKGEIDLVADDHGTLVFIEVKYRSGHTSGYAEESVTPFKQRTIRSTARYYICRYGVPETRPMRFDVIAMEGTNTPGRVRVRWIRDAFPGR